MELQGKRLLITGIGGCVGLRTAERAIEQGMVVKGIQRTPEKARAAEALGAEVLVGSITDPVMAARACEDIDIVLHTAGIFRETGDLQPFIDVHVGGSLTMAQAAIQAGVKSFVHLSSALIYGYDYPNQVTEQGPFYSGNDPYCKSKLAAEQALMALDKPADFGLIILRPGDVYGPRTHWITRSVAMMKRQQFVLIDGGKGLMHHLYLDNLIDAIFLTLEKEAYGEIFNVTDGCATTWKEFGGRLAQIVQYPPPISLAKFAVKTFVKLNLSDEFSMASINTLLRPYPFSIEKIKALGYSPRIGLNEGMAITADWLRQTELVKQ
ncbi:MAG: NAD-dependent epimerase/dehydratase family protein [Elainella sp.]